MSVINELIEHRTKLLAMKTSILISNIGGCMKAGQLDKDIKAVDLLIEKAITHSKGDANK